MYGTVHTAIATFKQQLKTLSDLFQLRNLGID
jgi:hypothetical protein